MNGYEALAESCRQTILNDWEWLTDNEIYILQRKIRVYEALKWFDDEEKYAAFDSGMFNDILRGYVVLLTRNIDPGTSKDICNSVGDVLEMYSAKQAENCYTNGKV